MDVKREDKDGIVVLHVGGELDFGHAPPLAVEAAAQIRAGRDTIIDISEVTFVDSTGAAMLLNACRRATRAGVGFAVVCPPGPARRTIEVARLTDSLKVCPDHATALQRLRCLPGPGVGLAS